MSGTIDQVTRDNFDDLLPIIKSQIELCDFVTIDTELTGLASNKANQYNLFDTPQDRYTKVRSSAINFGLLQYGISTFTYNQSTDSFDTNTYAFYLWPKVGTSTENGRHMLMQLSSIEFLVKWGFDFNLTFSKGVPFLSRADEHYRRNYLEKQQQQSDAGSNEQAELDVSKLNDEDKQFLTVHIEAIKKKPGEDYEVPPCNGFRRRLIHQEIPKQFPEVDGKLPLIIKLSNDRLSAMKISFVTPAEHEEHSTKNFRISMETLSNEVGFRHVLEHVIGARKPVIGHNCFMDFCHTYQKFIDKLPESYEDFKKAFNTIFPTIVDSKYFAASLQEILGAESTSLGDLYHFLSAHPIGKAACIPMVGPDGQEHFHDAGFDAYCTGQVFLGLCAIVGQRDNKSPYQCMLDILANSPPSALANRLFMMQSDCEGMYLAGPEDAPDRTAIVHMSNFDSSVKTSHVQSAFSDAGFSLDGRSVIWVDDQTVFVRLASQEDAIRAAKMKTIKMPVGKRATLMTYDQFIGKDLPAKRKLSLSPINLS